MRTVIGYITIKLPKYVNVYICVAVLKTIRKSYSNSNESGSCPVSKDWTKMALVGHLYQQSRTGASSIDNIDNILPEIMSSPVAFNLYLLIFVLLLK